MVQSVRALESTASTNGDGFGLANSLYYRESGGNVVVVSEPLDAERAHWTPVPPGHMLRAPAGEPVSLEPFLAVSRIAAE